MLWLIFQVGVCAIGQNSEDVRRTYRIQAGTAMKPIVGDPWQLLQSPVGLHSQSYACHTDRSKGGRPETDSRQLQLN